MDKNEAEMIRKQLDNRAEMGKKLIDDFKKDDKTQESK
jgi:hypothetical protein